jgi:hypothetical protein
MKITKKEGLNRIKIEHNRVLFWIIIALIVLLIIIIVITKNLEKKQIDLNLSCSLDSDCVPASCCHASSCINRDYVPNCSRIMCTMECRQGTFDCNNGKCSCINGKCSAVFEK